MVTKLKVVPSTWACHVGGGTLWAQSSSLGDQDATVLPLELQVLVDQSGTDGFSLVTSCQ